MSCLLVACSGDRYCLELGNYCTQLPTDAWYYLRWVGLIAAVLVAVLLLIGVVAAIDDYENEAAAACGFFAVVCVVLAWWAYPGWTTPDTIAKNRFLEYCRLDKIHGAAEKQEASRKAEVEKRLPARQLSAVSAMDSRLRKLISKRTALRRHYKKELGDYLAETRQRARQAGLKTHGELLAKKNDHLRTYLLVQRVGWLTHLLSWLESTKRKNERVSTTLDQHVWHLDKAVETNEVMSDKKLAEIRSILEAARAVLADRPPRVDRVKIARFEREAFQTALAKKRGPGAEESPGPVGGPKREAPPAPGRALGGGPR